MGFPSGPPVCYLDFDGVVHFHEVYLHRKKGIYMRSSGHKLFEWSEILVQLFAPYPGVQIVLSTAWVPNFGFTFAKKQLPHELQSRVVGATFHTRGIHKLEFLQLPRGAQVIADVERRKPRAWFALDDDELGWPSWCRNRLVLTDGRTGLSDSNAQLAVQVELERLARS